MHNIDVSVYTIVLYLWSILYVTLTFRFIDVFSLYKSISFFLNDVELIDQFLISFVHTKSIVTCKS
jgi:hypothetical protein